jgi:L-alanine-DL-glutamate epimerase-like enolase superfamily enzyme
MKISSIEPFIMHVPLETGIADSTNRIDHWGFVGVIIHADNGMRGYGFTGTHAFLKADQQITNYINLVYGPLLLGETLEDRHCIERIWKKLHNFPPLQWIGRAGLSHLALAAVDIALWDLLAKGQRQPLWSMLRNGTHLTGLEAYDTNAGWLSIPLDRLVSGCVRSIHEGFRGVKIKVGSENHGDDLKRIEAVRHAIGPNHRLMIDGNGKWSLETARKLAERLDSYDLYWFEEPLHFDDLISHVALANEMRTPIALGEQLYSQYHFDAFMHFGAVKFVQVDALRVAGISEWLAVADKALVRGLPVVPHVGDMMQVHRHLAFCHPACGLLEYIPWTRHCFQEPATIQRGEFLLPEAPGAGTTFTASALEKFRMPLN